MIESAWTSRKERELLIGGRLAFFLLVKDPELTDKDKAPEVVEDPQKPEMKETEVAPAPPAPEAQAVLLGRTNQVEKEPDAKETDTLEQEPIAPAAECVVAVPRRELVDTFEQKVVGLTHGKMTPGQKPGEELERVTYGAIPLDLPLAIACQKGSKGNEKDRSPNQDNFSVTHFKNGYTLICTFDGHGQYGHAASTRAVQTVPWFMVNESGFDKDAIDESCVEEALVNAFEKAHKDLVPYFQKNGWNLETSGATAVAALFKGNKVWTANAGDSRVVIGSEADRKVIFETCDHTPESAEEKARIESMGGEVRSPEGMKGQRVFLPGEEFPGLGMSRTLGDQCVKGCGVIATPEVVKTEVDLSKQVFIIIATDGVWQFTKSAFAAKAVGRYLPSDGLEETLGLLQLHARQQWEKQGDRYCDDITAVLVRLR